MKDVGAAWTQIIDWYALNVPGKRWSLPSGANDEQLQRAESILGLQFPKDVRESYRIHNGTAEQALFPYGFHLLSLDELVASWTMWQQLAKSGTFATATPEPEGPINPKWWNSKWIPLTHNFGGDHQLSDLDPAKGGTVGQVIKFSHEVGPQRVVARSFSRWLGEFAEALESDHYKFDVDEGWLVATG